MINLYSITPSKSIPARVRAFLFSSLILCMSLVISTKSYANCTGCTVTISSNANYTIPAGQTYCLQYSNYTGTITFGNGSVLCIGSGITWSAINATFTGTTGTINNYGTGSESFTLPSGYTFNNESGGTYSGALTQSAGSIATNTGTFSGTLTQSGGTFTNNNGGTLSGTSSISGTFTNNGNITNTITVNSGGIFINNSTTALNAGVTMATGSTFTNSSTYSGTLTENGGTFTNNSGGTVSGTTSISGTFTNNGSVTNTITVNNGGVFNNNSTTTLSANVTMATGSAFNNSSTYSGTLTENGGTFTNNSGGTVSGSSTINGTFINNGSITGTTAISAAGSLTNNSSITGNIGSMASGATFTNSSSGTFTANITSSSGSTVTNSGTMTINGGTIAGTFITTPGSTTTNNTNGNITGIATIGGSMTNNGTMSGTITISATGSIINTASHLMGTVIVNGILTINSGTSSSTTSITVNSGGTINNHGTIQGGSLTGNAGSTINNYSIINDPTSESGILNNYSGANISAALTSTTGSVVTNYSGGQITAPATIAGTLDNRGTISNPITENAGGNIINAGSMSAGATVNGGTFLDSAGGSITNGGTYNIVVNGGNVTLNANVANIEVTGGTLNNTATNSGQINITGGTVNNTGTISGSYTQNGGTVDNGGAITPSSLHLTAGSDSITNLSGGTLTLPGGTNTLPSGLVVTNYGTLNSSSPITVSSGATLNLEGTQNMSGTQLTDNGTINLLGSLTVSTYSGSGALNEIGSGCNTLSASSNNGTGSFNGGQSTYGGGLIVNSYSGTSTYNNGASATVTAPTQQPSSLTTTLSGLTVSGSFTAPSTGASITGYVVLRYIGTAAPNCVPSNGNAYTVGGTVGACTVAALVTGGSTGTKTFTDNIPSGDCGENVYYEIYSYNGAGGCVTYDLTSPLINTPLPIPAFNTSLTASGPTTFCSPGSVILTATGGGTYAWSNSINTAKDTVATSATYTVTVTNTSGCTATASQTVTANPTPGAVTVSGGGTFCGSATLTASGGTGGTIYWENTTSGGTSIATPSASQTVSASGTYYFNAEEGTCWGTQGSATVTINALPAVAAIGGASAVCIGSSTTLTESTPLGTWSASNGSATISALGVVTGVFAWIDTIYYTTAPAAVTGCKNVTSKIITVNPLPVASITPVGPSTFCGSGILTASGGDTYSWSNGKITAADTVAASTLYTVTVTTTATGCSAAVSNNVTVNPVPSAPTAVTATAATICNGQTSQLKATSAGNTIRWWTAATGGTLLGTSASAANYPVTPSATTTYYAESYTAAGCVSATRVAVIVTVNPIPTPVTVSGGATQCGGTVTLTASGGTGGTIYWENTTSGGTSTTTPSTSQGVTASGTYYFNALEGVCWGAQGSAVVTINPIPALPTSVTATPATICVGQSSDLNATSAGNTIKWWTAATAGTLLGTSASGANFTVAPAATTTYYAADSTAAGCVSATRVAVTVTVNAVPVVAAITGPSSVCAAGTFTLSDATATGVWSSSNTSVATISSSGVVTGVAGGTDTILYTVTNAAGCATAVSKIITIYPTPTPTANSPTICAGDTAIVTATGGASYVWSSGDHTATIYASPPVSTVYGVTVTSTSGCTVSLGTVVYVVANPAPTVNNPATCAGGTDTLTATGAGTGGIYLWSTGAATASITTTTAGVYKVTVTNSSGCSATASGIATVNPLPVVTLANDSVCAGTIATLTASGGAAYVWSTGAHTASITTASAGTYTVTATSSGSCTASASGMVVLIANPPVVVNNGVICSGNPATLTASGASSYVWNSGATTSSISAPSTGTYSVTGTSGAGCTASATASVTTSANPAPTVNNQSICAGNSATLTATAAGCTFIWNTGQATASITVSPASTTIYTVTATNAAGCSATTSGTVTVNALPTPTVNNGVVCSGASATLTATGGTSYHWNTGATTTSISVAPLITTTYTVTVTNAATCTASVTSTVTDAVAPTATVNSPSACSATSSTLTATIILGGPCTYAWSTGASTASISESPVANTTYTVTVTNASGCTATAAGTVTVYALPTVTAASNSPILLSGTINLTSTVSGGTTPYTYSWSGPSAYTSTTADPSIASAQPSNAGVYNITVTDNHSCTAKTSTTVILNFTSPGGIPSNDALWLKANTGVTTSGSNVTAWNDQSGLGNNATTISGTAPTLVNNSMNYYPVVNYNGTGSIEGIFNTAITSSTTTAFAVSQPLTGGNYGGIFGIAQTGQSSAFTDSGALYFFNDDAGNIGSYRNGNYLANSAGAVGQPAIFTSFFSPTADSLFTTGKFNAQGAFAAKLLLGQQYAVGDQLPIGSSYLVGKIAEVILFNTQLSPAQKNQVESYLATKYGFTLNQTTAINYIASNAATFWNAASNGVYKNNIFGVGIDNISTLSQNQSVSINTNQLVIDSAKNLTFYSFLMVSDNGIADTLKQKTGLPNSINAALTTVWRASQTGSRGTENLILNASTVNFNYYAPIASSMTPYLLVDSNADGIYETYVAASTVAWPNITFNYSLNDGAHFTFGFKASIDYGDAWGVPTLTANNGAGHAIVPGVYLGSLIDAELDGQPSVNAVGDDTIGLADEDGVNFNIGVPTTVNIVTMGSNTIIVTASVPGYLNAWADLNQNNSYEMDDEYLIINKHLVAGANTVTFTISDSVLYGPTSMRFRFDTINGDVTTPTGLAKNGEVEDYLIYVTAPLVGPCSNGFQNPSFEQGPDIGAGTYIITSESNMPYWRTTATDGQIEQWGNNFNGGGVNVPAYNGTYFMELEANLYGALYQDVYTTPGTKLSWSFAHRGRFGSDTCLLKIGAPQNPISQGQFIDGEYAWGVHTGFYTVPAGQYITRLAFDAVGSFGGNQSEGNFLDDVSVISSFDYGDAPDSYGTLFASNGPYHSITGNLYLGYGETCDADGQPSAAANLDSLDDGVTFPAPCNGCSNYTVNIKAYNNSGAPATIAGWIDFNKNGIFDNNERASVTIASSASEQAVTLTFNVSAFSAASTSSYGRFRIANDSTQVATPYGFAASGEVEDYKIPCVTLPVPIPSISSPVCARGPLNLIASDSAYSNIWKGPNGFTSYAKDTTLSSVPQADSGLYTIYAVYSNGCVTDSSVILILYYSPRL
jgi:hypothetical protein